MKFANIFQRFRDAFAFELLEQFEFLFVATSYCELRLRMSRLAFSCLLLAVLVGVMGQNVEGEMARSFSATAGVKSAVSVEMTIITSMFAAWLKS